MSNTPRLRMFAGPNGSGKSTIKAVVPDQLIGVYVNPDEIEKKIKASGELNLADFSISPDVADSMLICFLSHSPLLIKSNLQVDVEKLSCRDGNLRFCGVPMNSYFASAISDFIRQNLLKSQTSFTFETVMSSPDKIDFLKKAKASGFRTYLYYVATQDPQINVSRVAHRVLMGGHDVEKEKILTRYARSLDLLAEAVRSADRAYIFDNSGSESVWLAEITDGSELEYKTNLVPDWFKVAIIDKFGIE